MPIQQLDNPRFCYAKEHPTCPALNLAENEEMYAYLYRVDKYRYDVTVFTRANGRIIDEQPLCYGAITSTALVAIRDYCGYQLIDTSRVRLEIMLSTPDK